LYRRSCLITLASFLLNFIVSILSGILEAGFLKDDLKWAGAYYIMMIIQTVPSTIILISPISLINLLLVDYILQLINQLLKKVSNMFEMQKENFEEVKVFELGFKMSSAIKQAEKTVGPAICITFALCFSTEIFGAFFFATLFSSTKKLIGLYFGVMCTLVALNAFVVMLLLIQRGQKMKFLIQELHDSLQAKMFRKEIQDLDKANILLNIWSGERDVFRPLDAFELGRASSLTMYGLLLTYIFVLLQFKYGE
jgi:uncharacterized membrane protein